MNRRTILGNQVLLVTLVSALMAGLTTMVDLRGQSGPGNGTSGGRGSGETSRQSSASSKSSEDREHLCKLPGMLTLIRCNDPLCTFNPDCKDAEGEKSSASSAAATGTAGTGNGGPVVPPIVPGVPAPSGTVPTIPLPPIPQPPTGNSGPSDTQPKLGCFKNNGEWTTDREACDRDQSGHLGTPSVQPPVTPEPTDGGPTRPRIQTVPTLVAPPPPSDSPTEEEIQAQDEELQIRLDEKFHTQAIRNEAMQKLRDAITSATQRMHVLSEQPLSPDASAAVSQTVTRLTQLSIDIDTEDLTAGDIEAKAGELRVMLQDAQQAIAKAAPAVSAPKADGIIAKLDGIFGALPNVFTLLQQEQVNSSSTTSTEYLTALTLYTNTRTKCLANADHCTAIGDVLNHLEVMRASLLQSLELSGKTGLEGQIDEMLLRQ